jgi:hypothetical protein
VVLRRAIYLSNSIVSGCSPLATYYNEARYYTKQREHKIDTITIHCYVAQVTAKQGCDYFANIDRKASCNYVVGKDGSIGISVPELSYSYCTSDSKNDKRAVTIEVASDTTHPYAVTDKAYNALINLVHDICIRNNIKSLIWSNKRDDRVNHRNGCNMTVHRDFANKACPGEYLYSRHGQIAAAVNARLNSGDPPDYESGDSSVSPDDTSSQNFVIITTLLKNDTVIDIVDISSTSASIDIKTTNSIFDYDCYFTVNAINNEKDILITNSILIQDGKTAIKDLVPNNAYRLSIFAKLTNKASDKDPCLFSKIFCTAQDYPGSPTDLNFSINTDNYVISFTPPSDWGMYAKSRANKGYRVSLVINGDIIAYLDDLISYGSNSYRGNKSLEALFKLPIDSTALHYGNSLQIGIQSWVLDETNNLILDSALPKCTRPIYLDWPLELIDRLYIDINSDFKRAVLYRT